MNDFVDEAVHFALVVHRRPAQINLGQQIHIAAAVPVIRLPPDRIAIPVPRAVKTGEIEITGDIISGILAVGIIRRRAAGITVNTAMGDHIHIAAEQHIGNAPVDIGLSNTAAKFFGIIRAGVITANTLHRIGKD